MSAMIQLLANDGISFSFGVLRFDVVAEANVYYIHFFPQGD